MPRSRALRLAASGEPWRAGISCGYRAGGGVATGEARPRWRQQAGGREAAFGAAVGARFEAALLCEYSRVVGVIFCMAGRIAAATRNLIGP